MEIANRIEARIEARIANLMEIPGAGHAEEAREIARMRKRLDYERGQRSLERRFQDGDDGVLKEYNGRLSLVDTKQKGKKPNPIYDFNRTTPQYEFKKCR